MSVATHYTPAIADRVSALDWQEITEDLDQLRLRYGELRTHAR